MEHTRNIHVWLGIYGGGDDAWEKYFDVEKYGSECGYCRPGGGLVIEVPYSDQFESELLRSCHALGISRASHCFTMIDFGGTVTAGSEYCGLTSVGVFPFTT